VDNKVGAVGLAVCFQLKARSYQAGLVSVS